jgi:hypothetical protein
MSRTTALAEQHMLRMLEIWSELVLLRWKFARKPLAKKELLRKKLLEKKLIELYSERN